jgi:hypothetical protein
VTPRILLGDADRDRLVAFLREHYVAGRLSMPELEQRVEVVLSAQYVAEAVATLTDLPGVPWAADRPAGRPHRGRHAEAHVPEYTWVPTAERFRDPSSRRIMRVWIDPADDSRHYVPEAT